MVRILTIWRNTRSGDNDSIKIECPSDDDGLAGITGPDDNDDLTENAGLIGDDLTETTVWGDVVQEQMFYIIDNTEEL